MRLIDADALWGAINSDKRGQEIAQMRSGKAIQALVLVLEHLHTAPTVDAVEVVRCHRCRFAVNKKENGEIVTYCGLDWGMRGVLDPNDYCSYGKEIKRCQD